MVSLKCGLEVNKLITLVGLLIKPKKDVNKVVNALQALYEVVIQDFFRDKRTMDELKEDGWLLTGHFWVRACLQLQMNKATRAKIAKITESMWKLTYYATVELEQKTDEAGKEGLFSEGNALYNWSRCVFQNTGV